MRRLSPEDLTQAKLDPASIFQRPEDVLAAPLPTADKIAILRQWEEDADALMRATDEGMPPRRGRAPASETLMAIETTLEKLGVN